MKYIQSELITETAAGGFECLKCPSTFKAAKKSTIKEHYLAKHAFKQPNRAVLHNNFQDREDYINVCVLHASANALPFRYWDCITTRAIHDPFNSHFNVSVNSKTMRDHFATMSEKIKDHIRLELRGRLFSVQCMTNFNVKVIHMGMIVMHQRNKSEYIQQRIEEILSEFGLKVEQIYTITTDNGTNVIKTSKDMLTEVARLAKECISDEESVGVDDNIIVLDDEDYNMGSENTPSYEDSALNAIPITDADSDDETEDDIMEEDELTKLAETTTLKGAASTIPLRYVVKFQSSINSK